MANFALINKDNVVIQVVSVNNIYLLENNVEVEQKGIDYLINFQKIKDVYPETVLIKQTSFNGNLRGYYAGKGYTYDTLNDAFIPLIETEEVNINDIKI